MPKMKTRSAAAKRFRKTSTGKVARRGAYGRHLLEGKSGGRKRRVQRPALVAKADQRRVRRMLGG